MKMSQPNRQPKRQSGRWRFAAAIAALFTLACGATQSFASEAGLRLPDLRSVTFMGGINGHNLLLAGLVVCVLGLVMGMVIYSQIKNMPVHRAMLEVSELIYATCKTYLLTQLKFIMLLWLFIGAVIFIYFKFLAVFEDHITHYQVKGYPLSWVLIILAFSLIGIAGSASVAFFGMRINTFANSRTSMASLRGKPFPVMSIPLRAGMGIGMVLISIELLLMLMILLFIPRPRRPVLYWICDRRIAWCGGPSRCRWYLHEDRRHRRGPDEDRLQREGRRCP
jgi:K(+)-stimulated pyrophosphate-energized sodium pump